MSQTAPAKNVTTTHVAVLVLLGLAARLWLIHRFPVIHGGDTIMRLANTDHIVLSHQLPALQAIIHYLSLVSSDPLLVRYATAVIGAGAGVGFYALSSILLPPAAAFQTSLLFVAQPFLLVHSTVPYQEILMVAGLLFAFYGAFTERWSVASISLGIACLTRYEAWLACPPLAWAYTWRRDGLTARRAAEAVLLLGWAPLAWIAYNGGLTPQGGYAIEPMRSPERLLRWLHLGAVTVKNTPLLALPVAVVGCWTFFKRELFRQRPYQLLVVYAVLFLVAILFSAQGVGDNPERAVTAREAHVTVVALTLLVGIGLVEVRRFRWSIVVACLALGLWMSDRYLARAVAEPELAISYRVARYLDQRVAPAEHVAVLAHGVDAGGYLAHLEQLGGPARRREGLKVMGGMDVSPPGYQRILVHSRLGKRQLHSYARVGLGPFAADSNEVYRSGVASPAPEWVVVWSDFAPTSGLEAALAERTRDLVPERVFAQGTSEARVYRLVAAARF